MKQIELTVVEKTEDKVTFFISKQTRIGNRFGRKTEKYPQGETFVTLNGIILCSCVCPVISYFSGCQFFVRGTRKSAHKDHLTVTVDRFKLVEEAVAEYNEYFKGKKKPNSLKKTSRR